jgi:hypothetical protein
MVLDEALAKAMALPFQTRWFQVFDHFALLFFRELSYFSKGSFFSDSFLAMTKPCVG